MPKARKATKPQGYMFEHPFKDDGCPICGSKNVQPVKSLLRLHVRDNTVIIPRDIWIGYERYQTICNECSFSFETDDDKTKTRESAFNAVEQGKIQLVADRLKTMDDLIQFLLKTPVVGDRSMFINRRAAWKAARPFGIYEPATKNALIDFPRGVNSKEELILWLLTHDAVSKNATKENKAFLTQTKRRLKIR